MKGILRACLISSYLFLFQCIFLIFRAFPKQRKIVCVASFGDNIFYTTKQLSQLTDHEIVILREQQCTYPFDKSIARIVPFSITRPLWYIKSIYHLATASTVIVDNYFAFLSVTKFRKNTTCIQLWHAAGAIKKFGFEQPTTKTRSAADWRRFTKVYNRFDYTIVGSETMAEIFQASFGLAENKLKRTGIPRTDFFFDKDEMEKVRQRLTERLPIGGDKKVILYAPTFRLEHLQDYQLQLDFEQLYEALADDYILLLKLHPSVSSNCRLPYQDFIYDVSDYYDINHLLICTDILITDYSSVPFEFSLLELPMIFYAYDQEEYVLENGLLADYQNRMPGPVVRTTGEIINVISKEKFMMEKVKAFSEEWNQYSKGDSSMNVARFVLECEEDGI